MKNIFHHIKKHTRHIAKHIHKQKHRYALGTFGSFAVVKMFILLTGFLELLYLNGIFAQTPPDCNENRDNDNFIHEDFWELNPTDNNIICALYGTEEDTSTAYTENRNDYTSGSCLSGITVAHIDTVPTIFNENTIYVLASGNYDITTSSNMATCSALISSGESILNKTGAINIIYTLSKNNVIIDNIKFNGNGYSNHGVYFNGGSNHTFHNIETYGNYNGIYLLGGSYNILENIKTYNNANMGIYFQSTSYNRIHTMDSYNNIWGMYMYVSSRNILSNINFYKNRDGLGGYRYSSYNSFQNINVYNNTRIGTLVSDGSSYNDYNNMNIYNNGREGLLLWSENNTRYNTFNNIHIYNNIQGISMEGGSTYNSFNNILSHNNTIGLLLINYVNRTISNNVYNNIQLYNNAIGLETQLGAKNNIYNNVQIYNNTTGTTMNILDTGNTYYGEMTVFGNGDGNILGNGDNFFTGSASTRPLINWNNGQVILTGNLSWDIFTNAISTSGNYLLPRSGTRSDNRGRKLMYTGDTTQANSYGSGILTQTQPVIWSGTTDLVIGGTFDTTKYIGSDTVKSSGTLSELSVFSSPNITVYGYSDDPNISYYSLFGDIYEAQTGIILDTAQEITFLSGDGEKRIVTQLFGDNNFSTHFQNTTLLDQTPPNQVTLILPVSGSTLTTSNIHLSWTVATDTGAGMSGYIFEIIKNNEVILSGTSIHTGTDIALSTNGNYERKIYAVDVMGNIGLASEIGNFTVNLPIIHPNKPSYPRLIQDKCPENRDCSDSYYDKLCGPCPEITTGHEAPDEVITGIIIDSPYSDELDEAYLWAYEYGITTMPTIQQANIEGNLIRKDMAKMITNFAVNVLDKSISTKNTCIFPDILSLSEEAQYYIIAACNLGLMGYESDGVTVQENFNPAMVVDRAQFGTILSRLLRENKNDNGSPYYIKHLSVLKSEGIMTKINNPFVKEMRGWVMLMMQRTFEKE